MEETHSVDCSPLICLICMILILHHSIPPCPSFPFQIPQFDFTRPLSGCVRELFSRLPVMDPELRTRFVSWLSYHLSNFDYTWPWDRWGPYGD